MDQQVGLRILLVFAAVLFSFVALGVFAGSDAGLLLGSGLDLALSFLSAQGSSSADCDQSQASRYAPFRPRNDRNQSSPPPASSGGSNIPSSSSGGGISPGFAEFLSWIGILLLALLLIALLYFLFKNLAGRPIYRASAAGAGAAGSGMDGLISARDAFSEAERLAAQGEFRGALRLLYQGVLAQLARVGLIEWERRRTNWEVLRMLEQRGRHDLQQQMLPMTRLFDQSWYGQSPISAGEYQSARTTSERIVQDVRPE